MRMHGPWRITSSKEVYRDPWIGLNVDQVLRPDGSPGTYCTVHLKAGVCVIAVDEQENVYLTSEFHYAVGRVTLEGVSGGIEDGEEPLSTAKRELLEELGISAKRWDYLGQVDPFTAAVLSPTKLYLARQLTFGDAQCEATEQIECIKLSLQECVSKVLQGEISHAPTCVALLQLGAKYVQPIL